MQFNQPSSSRNYNITNENYGVSFSKWIASESRSLCFARDNKNNVENAIQKLPHFFWDIENKNMLNKYIYLHTLRRRDPFG